MFKFIRKAINLNVLVAVAALTGISVAAPSSSEAAQLLMFSNPDCSYCNAFDRDTALPYRHSALARKLPLVVLDMTDRQVMRKIRRAERDGTIKSVWGTPTFVLWDQGKEVARFSGYRNTRWFVKKVTRLARKHGLISRQFSADFTTERATVSHVAYKFPIDQNKYRRYRQDRGRPIHVNW